MKDKWIYNQYIDFIDPDYTSYNLLTTRDYRYQDSGNWKDLLTYYFGSTITYDAIGNPLNYRNGMTMTWVNGRRLSSVTNSGVTTTYTYNDDGIRLTKQVGNNPIVTYETDGGLILCQKTGAGSSAVYVYFFYDESGNAYAMKYNGDMYYYLRNGQGDIIGIIDDTGAIVARYTYDPWGKPLTVKDGNGNTIAANATHIANANPFRYRGYFYDTETGFYYLQSRYYDPVTGRFINADDVSCLGLEGMVTSYNLFTYCANDPINRFDDSGYGWFSNLIKAVVVVAVVVAVAAVTVATAGAGTVAACIAVGAAKGAAIGMVSGAAIGAGAGAINHRIQTGSWEGAGQAALEGMGEGALSGAITGAITGAAGSAAKVWRATKTFDKGGFPSSYKSLKRHYNKHVVKEGLNKSINIIEYADDAVNFSTRNASLLKYTYNYKYNNYTWNFKYVGQGGQFTSGGKTVTFWYKELLY